MCTVTWWRGPDRYEVLFNRDERRTRLPGRAPQVMVAPEGARFVAPLDPQGGGSWLAANARGVTAGLLNHYEREAAAAPADPVSRGLLLLGLMDAASAPALVEQAAARASGRFAPFLLLAFDAAGVHQVRWDGARAVTIRMTDAARPVSTSSFDPARVIACRRARYAALAGAAPTPEDLERYHFSVDAAGGPYSVCMTREDARTVSFSRVRVAPERITFDYQARTADNEWSDRQRTVLPRT